AGAQKDGYDAEGRAMSRCRSQDRPVATVDDCRLGGEMGSEACAHGRWRDPGNIGAKQPIDYLWVLAGRQAEIELSRCPYRYDGFDARPLIAAGDSVDGESWPDRGALIKRITGLTAALLNRSISQCLRIRGTELAHIAVVLLAPSSDSIIEA